MKTVLVEKRYCTEVSVNEMKIILSRDGTDFSLFGKLFSLCGVSQIEYDAAFGPSIWYSIHVEHDNEETHAAIEREIRSVATK